MRLRGEAMQKAVPVGEGAMAAILGLEFGAVVKIATQAASDLYLTGAICQAANDNGGGQVVISGTNAAVERAIGARQARRRETGVASAGLGAVSLRADEAGGARCMKQALKDVKILPPKPPLVANVDAYGGR